MKKIYGIVGHPVTNSLSPVMHNAAFRKEGIDAEYRIFDIDPDDSDNLANFCYETDLNNIAGFSVTMPYKQEIMRYMDHYDPLAKIVGSVNTVANEDSKLVGYNTDSTGAVQALQEKIDLKSRKVLIMGAGGVARSISYGLKEFGADVYIFNRTAENAAKLAEDFELETIGYRQIPNGDFDVIINATPTGSLPNTEESLLHADQMDGVKLVMDVVTYPMETQLLKEAKKAGADVITGERMLLHQAAGQFEVWFGKSAPLGVMELALYKDLEGRK
ncbi:shikimate dehydrogenase [Patescibacteria group bacterium]|nr:shikimate dehydrogenase [Patescibacteria group bacterium]MBU1935083.1 shikimate dehydrogenase [Patescibacteria group bacterium]